MRQSVKASTSSTFEVHGDGSGIGSNERRAATQINNTAARVEKADIGTHHTWLAELAAKHGDHYWPLVAARRLNELRGRPQVRGFGVAELIVSMAYRFILFVVCVAVQLSLLLGLPADPTFARPGEAFSNYSMNDYLAHFIWLKRGSDEIASSFALQKFSYETIGTSDFTKQRAEDEIIPHLAEVSGLSVVPIKGSTEPVGIFIIKDKAVMTLLANDPDRFRKIGIPDKTISLLQNLKSESACKASTSIDGNADNITAFIISADLTDKCMYGALYNAFGIDKPNDGPSADLSLCILYEARWRGKRSREEIASVFADVKKACETRLPGA
ncbi:hypothetical protein SAMN05444161_3198 [Rhizobiales bacterium GAS191]|nr:hypothetical protein SAMN05444161_3198 [Rhizobiales bacterium GAS191]